jgi:hypothetical protein
VIESAPSAAPGRVPRASKENGPAGGRPSTECHAQSDPLFHSAEQLALPEPSEIHRNATAGAYSPEDVSRAFRTAVEAAQRAGLAFLREHLGGGGCEYLRVTTERFRAAGE